VVSFFQENRIIDDASFNNFSKNFAIVSKMQISWSDFLLL